MHESANGTKRRFAAARMFGRFSNRPIKVKRFQTILRHGVDVAHGLALLSGLGTEALPSWDSRRGGTIYWAALPSI